jgi:hypothetical protein
MTGEEIRRKAKASAKDFLAALTLRSPRRDDRVGDVDCSAGPRCLPACLHGLGGNDNEMQDRGYVRGWAGLSDGHSHGLDAKRVG